MKTSIWTVAGFSILMAGCGNSGETVVKTPDGTVTANKSGDTVTFKSDEGTATYTQNDAGGGKAVYEGKDGEKATVETTTTRDDKVFEGLLYPGAEDVADSNVMVETPQGQNWVTELKSYDSLATIVAFYEKALPGAQVAKFDNNAVVNHSKEGRVVTVGVSKEEGKDEFSITISITKVKPEASKG